jgi:NTP pyrophosphatase (non-canonical NTP hydrolase)
MSLNHFKKETLKICFQKGWDNVSIPLLWMLLTEEVGELASAIRRTTNNFTDKKKIYIEGEIMDVMSYLFQIADRFDVDLDAAWAQHIQTKTYNRVYHNVKNQQHVIGCSEES